MPGGLRQRSLAVAVSLIAIGGAVAAAPPLSRLVGHPLDRLWSAREPSCQAVQVQLTVAPELAAAVTAALEPARGIHQSDGHCLQVVITAESPADTVRKTQILPVSQAPQLWIPDSTLWERKTNRWPLQSEGSFATSPLVIATSEAAAGRLGWTSHRPTWARALSGVWPVAMPDLRSNASGLLSVLRLWQTLGKEDAAEQAVAEAVLTSNRFDAPTPDAAVDAAVSNDPLAPLLVTSELTVFTTNRHATSSRMVAVYPQSGSPSLDCPIIRVNPRGQSEALALAVDTVVATLQGTSARDRARQHGLRDVGGRGLGGAGVRLAPVDLLDAPTSVETTTFLALLQRMTRPSQLTLVIDVSPSMRTMTGNGLTRAQLAGKAAVTATNLLSDRSAVGLWIFSRNLPGESTGTHYRQADQVKQLGRTEAGHTHREILSTHLKTLDTQLGGNGTALYATTLAALKSATKDYNSAAVNSVVLLTDGVNDDSGGISFGKLTTQLKELADPEHPVRLIAIGLGPNTDLTVLQALTDPSDGVAYRAITPERLTTVLVDALTRQTLTPSS